MKEVFILLLLILFGPLSALAQIDSSYQSSYYLQKVSQYNMFPVEKKKMIMFIGDSITDIAEWNELFGTDIILNRGISADNTFGVFNRLDDVARRKPSKVFIMIGINDISHNIPMRKSLAITE